MSTLKKEYMTIFYEDEKHAALLPYWFIHDPLKRRKIIRVLGVTVSLPQGADSDALRGVILIGNLTKDFPRGNFQANTVTPDFNYIMTINNYNYVKEWDITDCNLTSLQFAFQVDGSFYDATMTCIIELELVLQP
jgi:hypothetical protein